MPDEPVLPEGELRRLHTLTPSIRGWRVVAVLAAGIGQEAIRDPQPGRFALIAAFVIPVAVVYGLLSWWFTRFRIEGGDLRLETGVLFRRTRHIRLERLQAVDVVRPLLARFAGLAELRLEVAGGSRAKASLAYLAESDALAIRAELLARAAGVAPETSEAPERVLVRVPLDDLLISIALSVPLMLGFLGGVVAIAAGLVSGKLGFLLAALPGGVALASAVFNRFATHFDFVVADSPDGLRLRHGLLEHRSQTVPPGRVQAVRIVQPLLWRRRDWVRVQVSVAGYAGRGESSEEHAADLLPVAPRAIAGDILATVFPGVALDSIEMHGVPRRARLLRPVTWHTLGCGSDERVFVCRWGLFRRQLAVMPHGKIQSVRLRQGPVQRRLRLATVHLDTTPGPVRVVAVNRDLAEAAEIVVVEAESSRVARRAAPPEQWMTGCHHGS